MKKLRKCKAIDCKVKIEEPYLFCSIECKIYTDVREKLKNDYGTNVKESKRTGSKQI